MTTLGHSIEKENLLENYIYSPLSGRKIRLLQLHAGHKGDPLQCSLVAADITEANRYEAVSYVWGKPDFSCPLQIFHEGAPKKLQITPNLSSALNHFREDKIDRILWCDHVCINQEDQGERARQVLLMGNIYGNASRVLVWLGEEDRKGAAGQATACLEKLKKAYELHPMFLETDDFIDQPEWVARYGSSKPPLPDTFARDFGIFRQTSPEHQSFIRLLDNPWFKRAWTFQESRLAQEKDFYYGDAAWPRELLAKSFRMVGKLFREDVYRKYTSHKNNTNVLIMTSTINKGTKDFDLVDLLTYRRGAGCRFSVDLIYSLLGTAVNPPQLTVDYTLPFEVGFARATAAIISHYKDLRVLGLKEARGKSTLPSWVPDWRTEKSKAGHSSGAHVRHFAAAGPSEPIVNLLEDDRTLLLRGKLIDRIAAVHPRGESDFKWLGYWADKNRGGIAKPFLCGSTDEKAKIYPWTGEPLKVAQLRTAFLDLTSSQDTDGYVRWNESAFDRASKHLANEGKPASDVRVRNILDKIQNHASVYSVSFVTERGLIGLAPEGARAPRGKKPGDVVAVVLGGRLPFILSPTGVNGDYKFVGESYVHALMDGQGLEWNADHQSTSTDQGDKSLQELTEDIRIC